MRFTLGGALLIVNPSVFHYQCNIKYAFNNYVDGLSVFRTFFIRVKILAPLTLDVTICNMGIWSAYIEVNG